ncbi:MULTISPECIES: hypothetical protein [unclassified Lysinibacillus]|uniref:hypothetical protein n=1 Tax=unclassified Lysinibacillus TaxID=2636778 RepID=UPI00380EB968
MPILRTSSVQILFGNGDVGVRLVGNKKQKTGAIQFTRIDPVPIGTKIKTDEMLNLTDAPVTLGFNKVESLDVVINQLLKLRYIMSGEGEYEWTTSGSIIDKD